MNSNDIYKMKINGVKQRRAKINNNLVWKATDILRSVDGQTVQRNLPEGYTQLEYIESTGAQYIDTGIYAPNGYTADFEVSNISWTTGSSIFFCGTHAPSSPYQRNVMGVVWSDGSFYVNSGEVIDTSSVIVNYDKKYHIVGCTYENSYLYIDGTLVQSFTDTNGRYNATVYVFAENGYETLSHLESFKMHNFKLKLPGSDDLVCSFIPCKNPSGVAGMYDMVSKTFYSSATSTAFVAGPEATPSEDTPIKLLSCGKKYENEDTDIPFDLYEQVEYIESTGTQYIDTGYKITKENSTNFRIVVKSYIPANGSWNVSGIGDVSPIVYYGVGQDNKYWCGGFNTDLSTEISALDKSVTYDLSYKDNTYKIYDESSVYFDGSISPEFEGTSKDRDYFLFAYNSDGNKVSYHIENISFCKMYNNDILIRNFVPCYRKSDNVAGMYDTVNGEFYTNQGTGDFLCGPSATKYILKCNRIDEDGSTILDSFYCYLDEPLRKRLEVADEISPIGTLTRNVGVTDETGIYDIETSYYVLDNPTTESVVWYNEEGDTVSVIPIKDGEKLTWDTDIQPSETLNDEVEISKVSDVLNNIISPTEEITSFGGPDNEIIDILDEILGEES